MPQPAITVVGTVRIDSKSYQLARVGSQEPYAHGFQDEPPWAEGSPAMVGAEQETWDQGGFKSSEGFEGVSEYGRNTDGRWRSRLLPSAKINTLTLTSSAANPTSIFEALGYVFVVAGRYIYRIDPATDTVVLSKDLGAAVSGVMGLRWEEDYALVTTSEATNSLYKLVSGGIVVGGPDTWTQTSDVEAYWLAAGINRLFKVTKTGELRNCATSLDPMTDANWADSVQVGETSTLPTGLVAYERTVFVGKPEGLFGVGDDGFGLPLIKRMARHADNCRGMAVFDPWVFVPHVRGLYRFVPGIAEACGLEKEKLNESPVKGLWKGFAFDSGWIYGLMAVGSDTYVLAGREREGGEPGFGPIVWDTWLYFAAASKAAWLSALTTTPRLWFGHGNNIAYVELANGPGAVKYATSGNRFSPKYRFRDFASKDFPQVDVVARAVDANTYWTVNYSLDGGAYSSADINAAVMKATSVGRTRFVLPTTAVGREIQLRFDYTGASEDAVGELRYYQLNAVPQSRKVPLIVAHLFLEEGVHHDEEIEQRTAIQQFNDLAALLETVAAVATVGPWGELNAKVSNLRIVDTRQEGDYEPNFVVEVALQIRESS